MWFFSFQEAREIRAKARELNAKWDALHSPEYMDSERAYLKLADAMLILSYDCIRRGVPMPKTLYVSQERYDATAAYRARYNQPDLKVMGVTMVVA